jgi:hypothetical protein
MEGWLKIKANSRNRSWNFGGEDVSLEAQA